ncbi:MAG: serine protease [Pseudomonadota bacterium]
MRFVILVLCALLAPLPGYSQEAQSEEAWLQIAAERNIDRARAVAERFAGALPGLALVELGSSWIAVAAGPMPEEEAEALWRDLRAAGAIPGDSYLADGARFGAVLWRAGPPQALGGTDAAALREVQRALAFEAYYAGPLDGRLTGETRAAIARWRAATGRAGTGPLEPAEAAALLAPMQGAEAAMGFETERDAVAGITVDIPTALVAFDRHDAPYARYAPRDDSGVALRLTSLPGGAAALSALYDRLQADPEMPETGFRELQAQSFVIMGSDAERRAYGWAEARDGAVKGFLLTWPATDVPGFDLEARDRAVSRLRASFRPEPGRVMALPPNWDLPPGQSGSEAAPVLWRRAGVAVSADGAVLTLAEGLESCAAITLGAREGRVMTSDGQLALLQPESPAGAALPATLLELAPAPGTPVTLAGFGQDLGGGSLRATPIPARILQQEGGELTLDASLSEGDDGGPVLTETGALAGLVLPGATAAAAAPRALATPALRAFLQDAGVLLADAAPDARPLTPLAQAQRAQLLTVAVTCRP